MNISLIKQYVCLQTCAILFNVQYIRCLGHNISKLSKMVYPDYYSTLNSKGKFVKRGIKSRTQNLIEKKKASVALKNRVNSEINVHEEIENFKIPFVHGLVIIDLEHLSKVRTCFVDDTLFFIYFFSFFENSHVTSSPSLSNDKPNYFMCVPSSKR